MDKTALLAVTLLSQKNAIPASLVSLNMANHVSKPVQLARFRKKMNALIAVLIVNLAIQSPNVPNAKFHLNSTKASASKIALSKHI